MGGGGVLQIPASNIVCFQKKCRCKRPASHQKPPGNIHSTALTKTQHKRKCPGWNTTADLCWKERSQTRGLLQYGARHIPTIRHNGWPHGTVPWPVGLEDKGPAFYLCAFSCVASIPQTSPLCFYLDYSSFSFTTRLKYQLFQETFLGDSLPVMLP